MKETIYTIPLNDAFHAEDECPFCRLERDAEQHALEFILGKQSSYMEDDIRMETDRIGFCRHHYKMMYDFGNRLGCGLMLSTHLKKLNEEMNKQIKSFTSGKSTLMGRLKKTDLNPDAPETQALAAQMEQAYGRSVLPVSCIDLDRAALHEILRRVLYEFPVRELDFAIPRWVTMLDRGHWLQTEIYTAALDFSEKISRMKDVPAQNSAGALASDSVERSTLSGMDLSEGIVRVTVLLKPDVFYRVLSEQTGLAIGDEAGLMPCIIELSRARREYEKIRSALEQVEATGYGIVMPTIDELSLEEPEIIRQGGRYGVRLEASAPSIHMLKAVIHTEINPIVGTEKQSEDLVQSLLGDFESDPERLWESNIFGKSLHELVNEGLQNKLLHMPQEARGRLQDTLEKVINDGCSGLICILL